jgi:sec-independent protein translocase protein TatA
MINSILAGILGGQEIIVILIVALILFGGKKIPELMRGIGKGVSEFKKGLHEIDDDAKLGNPPNNNSEKKDDKVPANTDIK